MLSLATISPHPPIIIPSIGGKDSLNQVKKTVQALKIASREAKKLGVQSFTIISPHGLILPDFMTASKASQLV
ncbi:MAG TPA: hypothetical protein ENI16_00310 [Candidatus Portnoybacteria bacterium]|nr:hypothetical protein [Candidatus Portnoybacteria bacterium]